MSSADTVLLSFFSGSFLGKEGAAFENKEKRAVRKRLLRIPFESVAGLTLSDPVVLADRTLRYRVLLRVFWQRTKAGEPRMNLLKEYAAIVMPFGASRPSTLRNKFKAEGRRFPRCFACNSRPSEARHHIIQLQHGGPNMTHNVVNVCAPCHAEIHPWLKH